MSDPVPSGRASAGRGVSRRHFDEVIRRATELAARDADGDPDELISEADLYRIAREVGLSEAHIREALSEVGHAGAVGSLPASTSWIDRFWGPETLRVTRVVPGTPRAVAEKLDEYMVGGRLLQPVRRTPHFLQYRPAVDWMSQVARAASGTARRYYVASARSVEVHLDPVDEHRTHVSLTVDAGIRNSYLSGGIAGGVSAGGAAGFGTFMLLMASSVPVAIAGALTGGVAVAGAFAVAKVMAHAHRGKVTDVQAELEGVLDLLEAGGQPEPPPPAWRKWIERRFHGARRLLDHADPVLVEFVYDDEDEGAG
ncbi:MAG: hypothetical protein RQ745_03240 [Longimicrobiales bacterium]|nr:hypothetical protein [Longimicrobiales bacterium]